MLSFMGQDSSVVGRRVLDVVPELETQEIWKILNNVQISGEPYFADELPVEFVKDGILQMGYYTFNYVPIKENGKVTGILQVVINMTSQVKTRQKAKENEQRFQAAVQAMEGVLWTNSPEGKW